MNAFTGRDVKISRVTQWLRVRVPAAVLSSNNLGQVAHTHVHAVELGTGESWCVMEGYGNGDQRRLIGPRSLGAAKEVTFLAASLYNQ